MVIFLGEISKPEIRGTIISIVLTGSLAGALLGTCLETYFSAKITCSIYLTQCLLGAIMLMFVLQESPYFLVKSGKLEKAKESITKYFPDESVEEKLQAVNIYLKKQASFKAKDSTKTVNAKSVLKLLSFIMILTALIESTGYSTILLYMEVILTRGKSFLIEPKKFVIIESFFNLLLRLITCNVIDKLGRKFLLVTASITLSVFSLGLGYYFYLLNLNIDLDDYQWVPMVCLFVCKSSYNVGLFTSLHTLLSELFPANIKGLANSLALLTQAFFGFTLSEIFLPISDSVGEQYMFWTNSLSAFLITPFVILFLPETKGKRLEEI